MLGGLANQGVHAFDGAAEVFLARDLVAAFAVACGFAVFVVDINQVDVAGHIQLSGTQLAHADDPHLGALAIGLGGHAVQGVQVGHDVLPGDVEGDFGQPCHAVGNPCQACLLAAIELGQSLQAKLAQHTQSGAGVQALGLQCRKGGVQVVAGGNTGGQQRQHIGIATVQPLNKTRIQCAIQGVVRACGDGHLGWLTAGHNSC